MSENLNILKTEGLKAVEKNDMPHAIDCFSRALKIEPANAILHNNLANAYKQQKNDEQAKRHYQEAIRLNADYAEAHHNLATLFAKSGDYIHALEHYRAALHCAPDFTLAHYNLGLLLLSHQKIEAAKTQFKNVITLNPNHLQAHFYLGTLALDEGVLLDAEHHFKEALSINPEHTDTLVNLGVIALKRDNGQLSIDYFSKALALDEKNVDARHNLAATFIHHDRFENALTHYLILLESTPNQIEYQYNAGVAEMALGHLDKAQAHFEAILNQEPTHFSSLINLAAIHTRLDNRDMAINLLAQAHQINPDDAPCQFMLNALLGHQSKTGACTEYARNLFDNYALYYDQHLQKILNYTLPNQIARILHQLIQPCELNCTLDLGCGTGLSGVVLQEISKKLIGVDLSGKMLNQARSKNIYHELIESELVAFLHHTQNTYDLIVSADVLPYLGELETLFKALRPKLTNQGLFIFNIEISETAPWQLQKSARFSHNPQYIHALAQQHQLTIVRQDHITSRQQSGKDVSVILYVLQAHPIA